MDERDVWAKLNLVFQDVFEDDDLEIEVGPETSAEDIEDWDSMTHIQLLVAIEKAFPGVKFSTGEVANMKNVGEMVEAIKHKIKMND